MKRILNYTILCVSLFVAGCNDWLDVRPKSQVKEEDLFTSESGFRDALTGIYALMAKVETYGGQSTMGFMDMVAQTYTNVASKYEDVLVYNYKTDAVKEIIDNIWSKNYYAIANCNYLLANLSAHGGILNERLRNLIEGEALALRAFLHFDLLRGYAPSYKMGKDEAAIPYVREVSNTPVARLTVAGVLDKILKDLKIARELLKPIDPIGPAFAKYEEKNEYTINDYVTDDGFWLYRKSRLNYYGVTALMARVHLYREEMTEALQCAREVIDSRRFEFMTDSIENAEGKKTTYMEKTAQHEYITSLYVFNLKEGRSEMFFKSLAPYECFIQDGRKSLLFGELGVNLDLRYKQWFFLPAGSDNEYVGKYMSGTRIPLLKLAEMYLIAAEASGEIGYLETLRAKRGYATQPLPAGADLKEELKKEYQKEFIAEGQLFYFYKRQNLTSIPFTNQEINRDVYVFPVPDNELEFGNFK